METTDQQNQATSTKKCLQQMNWHTKEEKKHLNKSENNKKNPEIDTQLRHEQKWIFHRNRAIELDDINRNCCLLYIQTHQPVAGNFLRFNILF